MTIKKILSSALVIVMMFSMVAFLIPVQASAAHYSSVDSNRLALEDVQAIVDQYQQANFGSAKEMFDADLAAGYLDYATNGEYSIYVNRYTGVMYYINNTTGDMLISNSYNFNGYKGSAEQLTSQITVNYTTLADTKNPVPMHSSKWAAKYNQITVTKIKNGLRVSYAIGDTATRCLLPVMIESHEFEDDILKPMFDLLKEKMNDHFGEKYVLDYFEDYYDEESVYSERTLHRKSLTKFETDFKSKVSAYKSANTSMDVVEMLNHVKAVEDVKKAIYSVYGAYTAHNPTHEGYTYTDQTPEVVKEGMIVYKVTDTSYSMMSTFAKSLVSYCSSYTFEKMYEDEAECKYEHPYESKPVFRCALEYTFNEDGSLSVRLPSNSIVYDETEYILHSITPLQYFGAANFYNDGYVFIPDGSGSIIEFEDFRGSNLAMSSSLNFYGTDFCYSEVTGAHQQPLTMPVYGIVSSTGKLGDTSSLGYFAVLEEGSAMASMNVNYKASTFPEGSVYTTFSPYPADTIDLSDTISVGGVDSYMMVAKSKYTGSYVTRYVMLTDSDATYIGMANYYRDYLVDNGTLKALENTGSDLPLYLEALGSIEVVEKILTFPINVSKAITSFEDIVTIYNDLGNAKAKMESKAAEYDALAEAEDDNKNLKQYYKDTADNYRRLAKDVVQNIDDINFKLTGFSNGGLYFTYPTRVRWERVLGGKRGFKNLLKVAKEKTGSDTTFGVYPDFDFQYVNNTELFDGVGKRNTISRMVDNRYASKQVYSSITGEFDTVYAMIVSADALDRLYDKFIKRYGKYDATGISVSTLGSDLNSNFDEDNPVSRDDAQGYVSALLDRIANKSNYDVMLSQGNIYSVKYADHILGVATDASYYMYSSYAIPFVGMILHGYVNYTGAALNYSGSPDYDFLRSIENGASLYYIIGYQNTELMKDDEELNKYYSVSYENWFDDIVEKYSILNKEIGDLQEYQIVNHELLIGERVIDPDEKESNLKALQDEFVAQFDAALAAAIGAKLDELRANGASNDIRVGVSANIAALVAAAHEKFELDDGEALPDSFKTELEKVLTKYQNEYDVTGVLPENVETVNVDAVDYESQYQYVTGSNAFDENYDRTDYTVDNDLIVRITYKHKDGRVRSFILNYNIYDVEVTLENGEKYTIEKYGYERFDA